MRQDRWTILADTVPHTRSCEIDVPLMKVSILMQTWLCFRFGAQPHSLQCKVQRRFEVIGH